MIEFKLTGGQITLIDDDDFDRVSSRSWSLHALGYAYNPIRRGGKSIGATYLHRFIMNNPDRTVDHINRNKLDNRKENLRVIEHFQNLHNTGLRSHNTSGFKGINWHGRGWQARIKIQGRVYHLGVYADKRDAIRARALADIWFAKRTASPMLHRKNVA